ncbi:MAG: rhomboid family intramembrane serine protease [Cellulomonadaceae bacterium]|jgi:membrane associated rhomboid family serine protease|nr:rhomboid family intramembrane serine protease [Cellulomonadaceae bacterium]
MPVGKYTGKQNATTPRPVWQRAGIAVGILVGAMWVLELIDTFPGVNLDQFGIVARSLVGLRGVVFSPLLHLGWIHLIANTVPLMVVGFVVLVTDFRRGIEATIIIWLVGGLGTWLIAPPRTVTIGASGVVFGLVTYAIVRGWYSKHFGELALGVVVLVTYGSVLWGVLPLRPGVSWQGHLCGAAAGIFAAWAVNRDRSGAAPGIAQ